MNITVIIGSPKGMRGNTGRLLEEVMAGFDKGVQIELIELSKLKVKPCTGCDYCHKTDSCPIKDDYEAIKHSLLKCDGFVLASPNYIFSVTAQLKALFDRSGNILHCQLLDGKYGAVVETSGGGGDQDLIDYMNRFINSTGAWFVGGVGSPMAGDRIFPEQEGLFKSAKGVGEKLCRSIREKSEFPEQAEYRNRFAKYMQQLVEYRKDEWTAEYNHWQKK